MRREVIEYRLGALVGEGLVGGVGAERVGMALEGGDQRRIGDHARREGVELVEVGLREVGYVELADRRVVHRDIAAAPGDAAVERHVEHDLRRAARADVLPHYVYLAVRTERRDRVDAVPGRLVRAVAAGAVADLDRRAPVDAVGRRR